MTGHEAITSVETMDLVGGDLSMDFVNTASRRTAGGLREKLRRYDDLVTWAERVELASPERGARLRAAAAAEPERAEAVVERARRLRELIYRVFTGEPPAAADLESLGEAAGTAGAERRLEPVEDGYEWVWPESDSLEQLLWPIALSAAELLTSEDRERVKECAADRCNWLFVDRSRNRSRRWCDMKDCGNRAKARRFRERSREADSERD